jgi:hypothetical protein
VDTTVVIVIIAGLVLAAVVVGLLVARRRRLRQRFGPEYERAVDRADSRRDAHQDLRERQERRERFDIRPLTAAERDAYRERWDATQREFVDAPHGAVEQADHLIQDAMRARGYPVEDFEQRAADLSVDHPEVVEHYREGRRCAGRVREQQRGETTEEMRQAMLHFRRLFEVLVSSGTSHDPGEISAEGDTRARRGDGHAPTTGKDDGGRLPA